MYNNNTQHSCSISRCYDKITAMVV